MFCNIRTKIGKISTGEFTDAGPLPVNRLIPCIIAINTRGSDSHWPPRRLRPVVQCVCYFVLATTHEHKKELLNVLAHFIVQKLVMIQ